MVEDKNKTEKSSVPTIIIQSDSVLDKVVGAYTFGALSQNAALKFYKALQEGDPHLDKLQQVPAAYTQDAVDSGVPDDIAEISPDELAEHALEVRDRLSDRGHLHSLNETSRLRYDSQMYILNNRKSIHPEKVNPLVLDGDQLKLLVKGLRKEFVAEEYPDLSLDLLPVSDGKDVKYMIIGIALNQYSPPTDYYRDHINELEFSAVIRAPIK